MENARIMRIIREPQMVHASLLATGWREIATALYRHAELGQFYKGRDGWRWMPLGCEPRTLVETFAEAGELVLKAWFDRLAEKEAVEIAK